MRKYTFTEHGQELVHDLGAEKLFERLVEEDAAQPLLDEFIEDRRMFRFEKDDDEYKDVRRDARIETMALLIDSPYDQYDSQRNLMINRKYSWKRLDGMMHDDDQLFEIPKLEVYVPAEEVDAYVLGGVIGLQYVRRHATRTSLSKDGYESFGLRSRVDAAALVGAYLVNAMQEDYEERILQSRPSFSIDSGVQSRKISVGGTLHGDFIMSETTSLKDGIISPIHEPVEFAPESKINVAAYHSVEPALTMAMIESTFVEHGKSATELLVGFFLEEYQKLNITEARVGAFGDFGDGETYYLTVSLQLMLEGKIDKKLDRIMHSSAHAPQSNTMFEIVDVKNGIEFRNRAEEGETGKAITIHMSNYVDLFRILIQQAQNGLGRTSIDQHLRLLKEVAELLEEN